jgi:hypothetical protein
MSPTSAASSSSNDKFLFWTSRESSRNGARVEPSQIRNLRTVKTITVEDLIMARTVQTARKSAPPKQLKTKAGQSFYGTVSSSDREDGEKLDLMEMLSTDDAQETSLGITLNFASESVASSARDISEGEIFDFDDRNLMSEYHEGYTVCRKPRVSSSTMTVSARNFLNKTVEKARKCFPGATYVVLQDSLEEWSLGTNSEAIPQNKDPVQSRQNDLPRMLKDGKLNKCVLRGNKETGQFGLVATENLEKWTPIALDCGLVWSDDLYSNWLKENSSDPLDSLLSTNIPHGLFRPFFSSKAWNNGVKKSLRCHSFVVDCLSSGNEVKHLDDAGWIHCTDQGASFNPTVDAFAVLNLQELVDGESPLTVVYCANQDIVQGKSDDHLLCAIFFTCILI